MKPSTTRRHFLQGTAAGAAWLASRSVRGAAVSANDKLNVAAVGAGGRGTDNINDLVATGAVNVVALCDCDDRRASDTYQKFPNARRYRDWRKLLDDADGRKVQALVG